MASSQDLGADGNSADKPLDFERALARLESIVTKLEDGELGLTASLATYEEGIRLLKNCQKMLESAERRIELVTGIDAVGNPITAPFRESEGETDENLPTSRAAKRTRKPREKPDSPRSESQDNPAEPSRKSDVDTDGSLF